MVIDTAPSIIPMKAVRTACLFTGCTNTLVSIPVLASETASSLAFASAQVNVPVSPNRTVVAGQTFTQALVIEEVCHRTNAGGINDLEKHTQFGFTTFFTN